MIADCSDCTPAAADVKAPSRVRARFPWLGVLPALLYALAPKCPMCLVAYLSAFGVTFGMASFAVSVLGPLAAISVVLAVGFALWRAKVLSLWGGARPISCDETIGRVVERKT
jgi:hypothetical protein